MRTLNDFYSTLRSPLLTYYNLINKNPPYLITIALINCLNDNFGKVNGIMFDTAFKNPNEKNIHPIQSLIKLPPVKQLLVLLLIAVVSSTLQQTSKTY